MAPRIRVDLREAPRERWAYVADLGSVERSAAELEAFVGTLVAREYREEIEGIAAVAGCSRAETSCANLCYSRR